MADGFKRFSEFCTDISFEGDKIRLDDLLNQEILICDFKIKDSKKKAGTTYLTIHFKLNDAPRVTFTGSSVLKDQLQKYKEQLPFYAKIKKINNYYTLS